SERDLAKHHVVRPCIALFRLLRLSSSSSPRPTCYLPYLLQVQAWPALDGSIDGSNFSDPTMPNPRWRPAFSRTAAAAAAASNSVRYLNPPMATVQFLGMAVRPARLHTTK